MPQPLLDLGDIGLMLQGIGRGRRPQSMHAQAGDLDAGSLGIDPDQGIDPLG